LISRTVVAAFWSPVQKEMSPSYSASSFVNFAAVAVYFSYLD
jgi:hypothetical protein